MKPIFIEISVSGLEGAGKSAVIRGLIAVIKAFTFPIHVNIRETQLVNDRPPSAIFTTQNDAYYNYQKGEAQKNGDQVARS